MPIKDIMENGIFSDNYFYDPQFEPVFRRWMNAGMPKINFCIH